MGNKGKHHSFWVLLTCSFYLENWDVVQANFFILLSHSEKSVSCFSWPWCVAFSLLSLWCCWCSSSVWWQTSPEGWWGPRPSGWRTWGICFPRTARPPWSRRGEGWWVDRSHLSLGICIYHSTVSETWNACQDYLSIFRLSLLRVLLHMKVLLHTSTVIAH